MVHPKLSYQRRQISAQQYADYQDMADKELFDTLGKKYLLWDKPYRKVKDDMAPPHYRWFIGGKLNVYENLLGKHLETARRNKAALVWRGVNFQERTYTYQALAYEVKSLVNGLVHLGVKKGDRVLLYMPDIPETVISMLACACIGAIHVAYHMAYSAESLAQRLRHCRAKYIITCDGTHLRTRPLKDVVNEALERIDYDITHCIVVEHSEQQVLMRPRRDIWYNDLITDPQYSQDASVDWLRDADEPLFMIYTSSKSKTPRGVVHGLAGYLMWAQFTTEVLFDLDDTDIFWNTADLAWINGHTYGVYGPLALGATVFLYAGSISYENTRCFFDYLDKFHVTVLYTNPSLLRSVMRAKSTKRYLNRSSNSLRLIGCGGEKISEELYDWVQYELTNKRNLPIIQIWGQTETGGCLIAGVPGVRDFEDDTMMRPLPGVNAKVVDQNGHQVKTGGELGRLILASPLPSMLQDLYKDDVGYVQTFWKKYPERSYFSTGDGAYYDEQNNLTLTGRLDNVISTGGGRRSLDEIEESVLNVSRVRECAAIVIDHPVQGYMLVTFCVLNDFRDESYRAKTLQEIREHVSEDIGELNLPDKIRFTKYLPKAPDNQVNRDLLKEIALQMEGI
ncbi:MAG: AMP-binding protein [Thermodesulfobacteriota bacterium]|nr:AMP-binding protein [Thermodesulfobacteriota bacterium]